MSLKGKLIIVTGCGSGFGNLTAKCLDKMGAIVFATSSTESSAKLLKEQTSSNCHVLLMDITKSEDIDRAYNDIKQYCEKYKTNVWGIVNNAGIGDYNPFECIPTELFTKIIQVNLFGIINFTRKCLPLMRLYNFKYGPPNSFFQRGTNGRIINMASINGRFSGPYLSPYHTSKYGNIGFSDALRVELLHFFNIYVSTIEPSWYKTPLTQITENVENCKQKWLNLNNDELLCTYDINKWTNVLKKSNNLLYYVTSNNHKEVIDMIVVALSTHFPLNNYYPSWQAVLFIFLANYCMPNTLYTYIVGKIGLYDLDIVNN